MLNEIERVIQDVAMEEPGVSRQAAVQARIAEIRASIEAAKAEAVTLKDLQRDPQGPPPVHDPAITLPVMEKILTTAPATRDRFRPDAEIPGAYRLDLPTRTVLVTFNRRVLEENSPDVRLLTYLTSELEELLDAANVVVPELIGGEIAAGSKRSSP